MVDLMAAAYTLADRVAASAPLSLQAIKEIDRATAGVGERDAYRIMRDDDLPIYRRVYDSEDAAEGLAALGEKRKPNWKAR